MLAGPQALLAVAISALVPPLGAQSIITSDEVFHGQSPPVYPSRQSHKIGSFLLKALNLGTAPGTGSNSWQVAYLKARDAVNQMTLEEKVNLTGGFSVNTLCSGNIAPIPRLKFPGLCLSDGPNGVRSTNFVSSWPAGISVGASWNRDLASRRAIGMAKEFKTKGINVALGPVVGPLGRIASGGRNWEGFTNDPYLAGRLVSNFVKGMQSVGVMTSTKHFIANEQETNRNPQDNVTAVSSNVDDKTMHELYLWPFQDAVRAGSASIMCSYQRINNSYGCANSKTMNGLLKNELGFQGFVVSDWGAQHAGVATALAGLDMVMPSGSQFWAGNLTLAVQNGSVSESRLDDMNTRILAAWYQLGQDVDFPDPGVGMYLGVSGPYERVIATSPDSKPALLQGAIEGHVLLKNTNGALPLKSPKLISLFGYSSKGFEGYTPGARSWNEGQESLGPQDWIGTGSASIHSQTASNGTLLTGGGSGANQPAYLSSTFEALSQRAYDDNTHLWWDFHSSNPDIDQATDACIVTANAFASEGWDRPGLYDDFTDRLILNVASNCSNTIVVFQNAGVRLVDRFIDHPNITALIFAHLPGQDSGRALVSVLYGETNPSGKLPYSVPHNESNFGPLANATQPEGIYQLFPQSNFDEGVYIDYRAFDQRNITPRFEFGFGLSYTSFNYSNFQILHFDGVDTSPYPSGPIEQGGHADLWNIIAGASANVTNSGPVAGAEVAQLYVGIPGGPLKQLRGFEKLDLQPGETLVVSFNLTRRDLSTWDVVKQNWLLQKGEYKMYVGSSSKQLPLTATLII